MEILKRRKLVDLMKHFGLPLIAVECGVAGGSFSQELLEEGLEKIYCVDNWDHIPNVTGDGNFGPDFHAMTFKEYKIRFKKGYEGRVITLKGLSSEMHHNIPNDTLGLCYHDASHQYEVVKQDIENFMPKLVRGGIFAAHDYHNSGYQVKEAVDEYVKKHFLTLYTIPEEHPNSASVWFRKN